MKYNIGDKININGRTGTITQIFPDDSDEATTYEITFRDGSTVIECLI